MSASALLYIIAGRDQDGLFEVRCRRPSDGRIKAREWFPLADHAGCERFIDAHARSLDVYVGVAPRVTRSGGKAAIRRAWLLYVDADSATAAERVRRFDPAPTLIVRSGSGDNVHAYWALEHPLSPGWMERGNRRLAHHLGADVKATDAARILRPPGSLNHKHEPPKLVFAEAPSVFDLQPPTLNVAQIVGCLPDPPNMKPKRAPRPDVASDDPLQGVSADRYYTTLTGREVTRGNVTCPFHNGGMERNGSMRLYDCTWYCFVCCKGGSVYEFGAMLWGLGTRGDDFLELKRRLIDALGQ